MRRMLGEWASLPFLAGFLSKLDPCGYGGPKTRRSHINFHCEVAAGHLSPKASKREAGGGESEAQRITLERCWIDYEMGWKTPLPFWKPKFRAVFRGLSAQVLNIPQLCFTPLPVFFSTTDSTDLSFFPTIMTLEAGTISSPLTSSAKPWSAPICWSPELEGAPLPADGWRFCVRVLFYFGWGALGKEPPCTCKNHVMLRHENFCIAFPHPLHAMLYTFIYVYNLYIPLMLTRHTLGVGLAGWGGLWL